MLLLLMSTEENLRYVEFPFEVSSLRQFVCITFFFHTTQSRVPFPKKQNIHSFQSSKKNKTWEATSLKKQKTMSILLQREANCIDTVCITFVLMIYTYCRLYKVAKLGLFSIVYGQSQRLIKWKIRMLQHDILTLHLDGKV